MIWPAKLAVILFGHAMASVGVVAWLVMALPPLSLAKIAHRRHHPPLDEQDPPAWFVVLARAILVLALMALCLAILRGGDGLH